MTKLNKLLKFTFASERITDMKKAICYRNARFYFLCLLNFQLFNVSSVKNIKLVAPQILARVETYVLYSQNFLSSVSKAVFARMIQFYIMVNVLNKRSVLAIMTTWNINQDPLLLSTVKNGKY